MEELNYCIEFMNWEDKFGGRKEYLKKWKETIIVPIYKTGGRDRCENYRGIALGNSAYKILAKIILEKIKTIY